MPQATIDRLIVNSPYAEPASHWRYDRTTRLFDLAEGRRPAGYVVASEDSRAFDDPGVFVEIPLVNRIRPRVRAWREAGWPGVTGITKRLLEHWTDAEEFDDRRFFFCQIEAVETLIWLAEAPAADRAGLEIPSDGGPFPRLCAKMATGSGKTVVMAMLLAWQMLNKAAAPHDARFAKHVQVVAPGLTVRSRLAVLQPAHPENYYEAFHVVPRPLLDKLRQGKVAVRNWHALNYETDEKLAGKRSVDKRGPMSDEAYVRSVLGDLAGAGSILVVNDEAHHTWRVPAGAAVRGVAKDAIQEATKWVGGLDRIARARGILACYDFSATALRAVGKAECRSGAVQLGGERLRVERRHRGRAGQDAARGGARRRGAGRRDLQIAPLPPLQRRRGEGRPEPPGRARGAAARLGDEWLPPARLRLARDRHGMSRRGGRDPADDDYRRQPDRNCGACVYR